MKDLRKRLESGYEINIEKGKKIIVQEEIGRGSNCIVYSAQYYDSIDTPHTVRLKECYPNYIQIFREKSGKLGLEEQQKARFDRAKQLFKKAYQRNVAIKNTLGLTNSTSNTTEIYEANNTYYSVISFDEGVDYRKYKDSELKGVFEHVKALAVIIKKYHEIGYLHLDIKPENVLIVPETKERVMLFDFDSVIGMEELRRSTAIRLSFSDGFSAPEQIRGKISDICNKTDIYSIGAVVFYKLFERNPDIRDCSLHAKYNFESMLYKDERYQKKLYKKIEELFRKTLSISVHSRCGSMDEIIQCLDELINLADLNGIYLHNNFSYNVNCFVGRLEELSHIDEVLQENQVVFLSGIGGIGKTEIAKRYAYVNQEYYDNIIFLPFQNSLEDTFIKEDISINNVERNAEESKEEYFQRKMKVLRKNVTKKDLIILDNFDVEYDENLEKIFECPCKFIITTREDYRDYNYPQIYIDKMQDSQEIMEVFWTYNDKEYSDDELETIFNIIELVERHTMTVELVAKYLRETEESTEELYQKFLKKEGVTSTDDTKVKHRKDKRLLAESVNVHLLTLFNIFKFKEKEEELIKSLSLLGYIKISREIFLEFCDAEDNDTSLEYLIKTGWVKYDEKNGKVWMHQIILDLIYNYLKPTTKDCPHITQTMIEYLDSEIEGDTENEIRNRVADEFMERISGDDLQYIRLCIAYDEEESLDLAEKMLKKREDKEAKRLLVIAYVEKMKKVGEMDFEVIDDMEMDELYKAGENAIENLLHTAITPHKYNKKNLKNDKGKFGKYYGEKLEEILKFAKKAVISVKEYSDNIDDVIGAYFYIGNAIVSEMQNFEMFVYSSGVVDKSAKKIFDFIDGLFDIIMNNILITNFSDRDKETIIRGIIGFYSDLNIMSVVSCFLDEKSFEKGEKYKKILIELYEKMTEDAGVAYDEEEEEQYEETNTEEISEDHQEEDIYDITEKLQKCYKMYNKSKKKREKGNYWNECIVLFEKLGEEEIPVEIFDFLMEYIKKKEGTEENAEQVLRIVERIDEDLGRKLRTNILKDFAKKIAKDKRMVKYYVIMLVKYSIYKNNGTFPNGKKSLKACKKAYKIYQKEKIQDDYLENLIYKTIVDSYVNMEDDRDYWDKITKWGQKCNYEFLAQEESKEKDKKGSVKCWIEAIRDYMYIDNYEKALECADYIYSIIISDLRDNDYTLFSEYLELAEKRRKCNIYLDEYAKYEEEFMEAYHFLTEYYLKYYDKYEETPPEFQFERKEDEFARKIRDLAMELWYKEYTKAAINMYIISLYVVLNKNPEETILANIKEYMNGDDIQLLEKVRENFDNELNSQDIDCINETIDEIQEIFDEEEDTREFDKYKEMIEEFLSKHVYDAFEFLREEE